MTTIDDKVVAMSFDSKKFESGVSDTVSALDKLKKALHFPGAGKGLEDISAAAKRIDLSHIASGVETITGKLSALRLTAIAVFSNIVSQAVAAGTRFAKSFTIEPLKAGFEEYKTNLNAVQTILANTQASGATLEDVNGALLKLNKYSDQTIYNFSQMAKNIGTFTAAGVDLDTATGSIKGIANLAALSGSNAEQASNAMYQLSQAISSGRVSLQDWNSVVNAGMGGTVFQRALAQTAEAMGTLGKGAVTLKGKMKNVSIEGKSFRESIQAGPGKTSWLTSDVLTKTLQQFTGDLTDAELAAQGFNKEQIKAIQQTAKTAFHAATEVKSLSQTLDVAKEAAGSGWAQTWQIVFGNFGEAKKTFTGLSNAITGFINKNAEARNKVLGDWKKLGGRAVLIDSIKTAFHNLGMIIKPIGKAFRDIFPAKTGKDLYNLTLRFQKFTESLKPSPQTVENLRKTFRGLFALLDIGKEILRGLFTAWQYFSEAIGLGNGGILKFTGNIGDFLVALDKTLKKGDRINLFFAKMGDLASKPVKILKMLANAIADLFSGFSPGGFSDKLDKATKAMSPFEKVMNAISAGWDKFVSKFDGGDKILQKVFDGIINGIQGFANALARAVNSMSFEPILQVIRTGLFAGIFVLLKRFLGKGSLADQLAGTGGGFIKNISGSMDALRGSMTAMQQNIKAKTLKEIAIAIGLITGSVVALSFVDGKKLKASLAAMTVAFGELLGAMAVLGVVGKAKGFLAIPLIAGSMILLAGAIDTLTIAVVAMSFLSWEELAKGLAGVGALLVGITKAAVPLSKASPGLISAGVGITAMAVGMNIMALAVRQFSKLNMKEIAKGLAGVGGSLAIIVGVMTKMPAVNMVAVGAGLIGIAIALRLLVNVVEEFQKMDGQAIAKGLAAIGGALVIIASSMSVMPPSELIAIGSSLLIVSFALGRIAKAVGILGAMSWRELVKGLGGLAGSLGLLAKALSLMVKSLPGAAALVVASLGLTLLAKAMERLGKQSWKQTLHSLVALGGALGVVAGAALLLEPAVPALAALGLAMLGIGGGVALAGAGIAAIGVGLGAIAVAGPAAIAVLIQALIDLTEAIPEMGKNLVIGMLQIVEQVARVAPKFVAAVAKILDQILIMIATEAPKVAVAMNALLAAALVVFYENKDKFIKAGFDLIISLLEGIKTNIRQITAQAVDIVTRFLTTLNQNSGKLIKAGVDFILTWLRGVASNVGPVTKAGLDIVIKFLQALASRARELAAAGVKVIAQVLEGVAQKLPDVVTAGTHILVALIEGFGKAAKDITKAAFRVAEDFVASLAERLPELADSLATSFIKLLNGMADVIENRELEVALAMGRVGAAIVTGVVKGIWAHRHDIEKVLMDIARNAWTAVKEFLHLKSPSKLFMDIGENIMLGWALGISDNAKELYKSMETVSVGIIDGVKKIFGIRSPSEVMYELGQFVSQGFAQGIRGSSSDIVDAFNELDAKLKETMRTSRQNIISEQAKLKELLAADKPDTKAIKESQAIINQNMAILKKSSEAYNVFIMGLQTRKSMLRGLASEFESVSKRLEAALDLLDQKIQEQQAAFDEYRSSFGALPDLIDDVVGGDGKDRKATGAEQLDAYTQSLAAQAEAVKKYSETLEQLRALGLDDATYEKLLKEGVADQEFANALLAGGATAVEGINALDADLKRESTKLAREATKNLYQAGVDAARGLVKGLRSEKNGIRQVMEEIARDMIKALRKELESKSPSKKFMEIGQDSMMGMALGLKSASKLVTDAVTVAGSDAISAMQQTMKDISDVVTSGIDSNPTITPILDLTQVRSQSGELSALTGITPITAAASYLHASAISSQQFTQSEDQVDPSVGGPHVQFIQTNTSPKALSEAEIYRMTKNQLSQFKSAFPSMAT